MDVQFIDDVTGKVLLVVSKSGANEADAGYSTPNDINNFEHQGYALVSDNTDGKELFFDNDDQVDQHYEVHLTHGVDHQTESKTVKETIHYIYQNGPHTGKQAAPDYQATRTFTRLNQVDRVTGTITPGTWNEVPPFNEVVSPLIDNYTADQPLIDEINVTPDSADVERTVYYTTNPVTPDIPTPENIVPDQVQPQNEVPNNSPVTPQDNSTNSQPSGKNVSKGHETQLPQTGDSATPLVEVGLLALMGALGLGFRKKKNN